MFIVTPVTKKSKNGKDYVVLEVAFPNGYTKTVFLDTAEQFIAQTYLE